MSEEKALAPKPSMVSELEKFQDEVVKKAMVVLDAIGEASEYDDDVDPNVITDDEIAKYGGEKEAKRVKRIVRDVRKKRIEEPAYVSHQMRIVEMYERRKEAKAARGSTGNAQIAIQVVIGGQVAKDVDYDVIDVTASDRKEEL